MTCEHLRLEYAADFVNHARKLDRALARRVDTYLQASCDSGDPRSRGKPLTANRAGYWRYRVGDCRIIAQILDNTLTIIAIDIGHRSAIFRD